ncbi:MAG TPA: hypothetical protein VFQ38_21055 [Longimicrobiales bacterium]|nr:hypothetical protein [Longimicrobiales bacterium]
MKLSESGSIARDPPPIALKSSLNGEPVFRETLEITLDGTNVTAWFRPGATGGADLVGVFALGSSPPMSG